MKPALKPKALVQRGASYLRGVPGRNGGPVVVVLMVAIVGVGFGLRIDAASHPSTNRNIDSQTYMRLAEYLYQTGEFGTPDMRSPTDWSPGAVLFYAGSYYLWGSANPTVARLAVALLGVFMIIFAFLLGKRLARWLPGRRAGPAAGLITAALAAAYPTFIHINRTFMTESLAVSILVVALVAFFWASDRGRFKYWIVPGLLFGLLAMVRPEYLPYGFIFSLVLLIRGVRLDGFKAGLLVAAVFLASFMAPIVPWTVRNYVVLDRFVPVSTGGGKALFFGTYEPGRGLYPDTKRQLLLKYPQYRWPAYRKLDYVSSREYETTGITPVIRMLARKENPDLELDAALAQIGKRQLTDLIEHKPMKYAGMLVTKVKVMWRRGSSPEMGSPAMLVLHRVLLILALAGFVLLAWRQRWQALIIAILIAGITVTGAVLLAVPRRTTALMPIIFSLASLFMVWAAVKAPILAASLKRRARPAGS